MKTKHKTKRAQINEIITTTILNAYAHWSDGHCNTWKQWARKFNHPQPCQGGRVALKRAQAAYWVRHYFDLETRCHAAVSTAYRCYFGLSNPQQWALNAAVVMQRRIKRLRKK